MKLLSSESRPEQPASTATPSSASAIVRQVLCRYCCIRLPIAPSRASARRPFGGLFGLAPVRLGRGYFFVVQIAVGLGGQVHLQLVEACTGPLHHSDFHVMQRDDARERRDVADELAKLVVTTGEADLDRLLGVEILLYFVVGLEQLLVEGRGEPRLRDIHQHAVDLGLAGELAQHGAEGLLDVRQLLLVDVEIGRLGVLGPELVAQLLFLVLQLLELRVQVRPDEEIGRHQRQHCETDADHAGAEAEGPAARVSGVERAQFLEQPHGVPPTRRRLGLADAWSSSPLVTTWLASSTKLLPMELPGLLSTTSSSGSFIHCEAEMLRMKVDTRVEDWATPSNFNRLPSCLKEVR